MTLLLFFALAARHICGFLFSFFLLFSSALFFFLPFHSSANFHFKSRKDTAAENQGLGREMEKQVKRERKEKTSEGLQQQAMQIRAASEGI